MLLMSKHQCQTELLNSDFPQLTKGEYCGHQINIIWMSCCGGDWKLHSVALGLGCISYCRHQATLVSVSTVVLNRIKKGAALYLRIVSDGIYLAVV